MSKQVLPAADVAAVWREGEKYPTAVWVKMSDGQRILYEIHVGQPEYIERKSDTVGYQFGGDKQ